MFPFKFVIHGNKMLLSVVCLFLLFSVGCKPDASETPETVTPTITPTDLSEKEEQKESPWVGVWELVLSEEAYQVHPLLFQIAIIEGRRAIRILEKAPIEDLKAWQLAGGGFQEERVLVVLEAGESKLIFDGAMNDGMILGRFSPEGSITPAPARLIKSDKKSMNEIKLQQKTKNYAEFEIAAETKDAGQAITALNDFVSKNQQNPLIFNAYNVMLTKAADNKSSLEEVQKIVKEMKDSASKWGESMLPKTSLDIVDAIAEKKAYRKIASETFLSLKELTGEKPPELFEKALNELEARLNLSSDDDELQAKGESVLIEIIKESPFDFKLALALAEFYEREKRTDDALKIYSRLAILPGITRALRKAKGGEGATFDVVAKTRSLWKGEDADFEHYLDEVYEKEAFFFTEKEKPVVELRDKRRVTLVEMFTGASCPPCVAGDLALGGVEKMHPTPEFIAVRYHQHIPGPDPLTVSSGEERLSYYGLGGTPQLLINGKNEVGVGGFVFHAESRYDVLKPRINSLLSQISLVTIDLKASVKDGVISIEATAENIPETAKSPYLRLLIVDPLIKFPASNGIRLHEMIVRDMPGGVEGVAAKHGKAEQKIDRSVTKIQSAIIEGLNEYEKNRKITFDFLPLELKTVRVIAFVQDDATKEILQAAISPVLTVTP